jgi:hypothetical protein
MKSSLRIIVTGLIAQYPLGGVAWDYLQYVVGLARLGHDVYYFEDTGQWPYNPQEGGVSKGCEFNVRYLAGLMSRFGLAEKWAYRFPWGPKWFGLPDSRRTEVVDSADLLINVSGTLGRPRQYRRVRRLVYIDSDPVFTQVKLARGQSDFEKMIDAHDVHFSFGERLSQAVPDTGHRWLATRQPVVLSEWEPEEPRRDVFTTVMNWTSYNSVTFDGRTYGQKDTEFMRFIDLPGLVTPTALEVAVASGKTRQAPRGLLTRKGWRVVDPADVCPDLDTYRDYIRSSKAEWSVAKSGYVLGRPGWFSCRSACYLACGRPVVVQDTGIGGVLPVGEGIVTFASPEDAAAAVRQVETSYDRHARMARAIAEEYFDSKKVLTRLLDQATGAGSLVSSQEMRT